MKLIVGLGNPEKKYFANRHNVGFMAIDYLQSTFHSSSVILKKSDQFMNTSGAAVKKLTTDYRLLTTPKEQASLTDLFVVHDDLDIPLGEYKIQFAKGPKLHNGIESIENQLGTKDFWRIRIGVDSRDPENRTQGEKYVLEDFTNQERQILDTVFESVEKDLLKIVNEQ